MLMTAIVCALALALAFWMGRTYGKRIVTTMDYTDARLSRLRAYGEKLRDLNVCGVSYYGSPEYEPLTEVQGLVRLAASAYKATPTAPARTGEEDR